MIKMICDKCGKEVDQAISEGVFSVLSRNIIIECKCHGQTDIIELYRYQLDEGKPIKVFDPGGLIYRNIFLPTFKKTDRPNDLIGYFNHNMMINIRSYQEVMTFIHTRSDRK